METLPRTTRVTIVIDQVVGSKAKPKSRVTATMTGLPELTSAQRLALKQILELEVQRVTRLWTTK